MNYRPPPSPDITTLWVGNLRPDATEDVLRHMFYELLSGVRIMKVVYDRELFISDDYIIPSGSSSSSCLPPLGSKLCTSVSGGQLVRRCNGYGFVEFFRTDDAQYCLQALHGRWVPGRDFKYKLNWASFNITDENRGESRGPTAGAPTAADGTLGDGAYVRDRKGGEGDENNRYYGKKGGVNNHDYNSNNMYHRLDHPTLSRTTSNTKCNSSSFPSAAPSPATTSQSVSSSGGNLGGGGLVSLWIGSLEEDVGEEDVRALFNEFQFQTLRYINLIRDAITGASKKFGFLRFGSPTEAEYALKLMNGKLCKGKAIKICRAHAKGEEGKSTNESAGNYSNETHSQAEKGSDTTVSAKEIYYDPTGRETTLSTESYKMYKRTENTIFQLALKIKQHNIYAEKINSMITLANTVCPNTISLSVSSSMPSTSCQPDTSITSSTSTTNSGTTTRTSARINNSISSTASTNNGTTIGLPSTVSTTSTTTCTNTQTLLHDSTNIVIVALDGYGLAISPELVRRHMMHFGDIRCLTLEFDTYYGYHWLVTFAQPKEAADALACLQGQYIGPTPLAAVSDSEFKIIVSERLKEENSTEVGSGTGHSGPRYSNRSSKHIKTRKNDSGRTERGGSEVYVNEMVSDEESGEEEESRIIRLGGSQNASGVVEEDCYYFVDEGNDNALNERCENDPCNGIIHTTTSAAAATSSFGVIATATKSGSGGTGKSSIGDDKQVRLSTISTASTDESEYGGGEEGFDISTAVTTSITSTPTTSTGSATAGAGAGTLTSGSSGACVGKSDGSGWTECLQLDDVLELQQRYSNVCILATLKAQVLPAPNGAPTDDGSKSGSSGTEKIEKEHEDGEDKTGRSRSVGNAGGNLESDTSESSLCRNKRKTRWDSSYIQRLNDIYMKLNTITPSCTSLNMNDIDYEVAMRPFKRRRVRNVQKATQHDREWDGGRTKGKEDAVNRCSQQKPVAPNNHGEWSEDSAMDGDEIARRRSFNECLKYYSVGVEALW